MRRDRPLAIARRHEPDVRGLRLSGVSTQQPPTAVLFPPRAGAECAGFAVSGHATGRAGPLWAPCCSPLYTYLRMRVVSGTAPEHQAPTLTPITPLHNGMTK